MSFRITAAVFASVFSITALAQKSSSKAESLDPRPTEMTLGIGAGWIFPQAILEPNAVSLRLKLDRKLALEPILQLGGSAGGVATVGETTNGGTTTTNEERDNTGGLALTLAGNVRYSFASAGPVDFVGIGGIGIGYGQSSVTQDVQLQDELNRSTNSSLGASLNWGVGVEWFLSRNIVMSADATNSLLSWSQNTTLNEYESNGNRAHVEATTNNLNFGLSLLPTVRVLFHLYF